jgi:hypothetical protein
MNAFQWIALTLLGLLLVWEIVWFVRGKVLRGPWMVRCVVWLTAALAIAFPEVAQDLANHVGIQRGADLVFYLFALTFLGVSFYFYSRYVRFQKQLTEVVRHVAIQEARRGPSEPSGD